MVLHLTAGWQNRPEMRPPLQTLRMPYQCNTGKARAYLDSLEWHRSGSPASRASVLQALYGLTPAECCLADLLADGYEVGDSAERMRTKVETARTQLKTIFRKTGATRQAELLRMMLRLPGVPKVNS